LQVYSNGLSEVILGKAIKQFDLPRDEIVVLTKVSAADVSKESQLTACPVVFRGRTRAQGFVRESR
jgi:aryl-alcohol dehydrogenase-like predicted oxidoreductase